MITDPHEHLIQDVLEGNATPAQSAELGRLIETDPEIRSRHDELSGMFRLLAEAPEVELPAGLHDDIMRAVHGAPRHGAGRASSGARRTPWPMLGAFLAGATAATLVIVSIVRGPETGRSLAGAPASGAMAPLTAPTEIDRQAFAAGGGHVLIVSHRAGDRVQLDVHVRCARPVDLDCEFTPAALGVTGVTWSRPLAGRAAVSDGHVTLAATAMADCSLSFLAHFGGDAPVVVRVGAEGSTTLRTAPR